MSSAPGPDGRPARILIVDDERHNRQLLQVMLTPEGFHLLTAASGEEALAMVAKEPPDLILLDIMMPGMDGYQVAERIKSNVATKDIPVIMVTALHDRNARMLGLKAGAEEFLTKPVDRAELVVRVRNLSRLKAYGEDKYSRTIEGEVGSRTAGLLIRTRTLEQQAAVLTEQAALLDLAQDAIMVRDMQNRILFWSRGAEVMFGWLSEEALGKNTHALLRTEFLEPTEEIEATLLRQGQWEGEAVYYKRDGKRVIVASRCALQSDAAGAPVRILTITNDITDRKRTEGELLLLTEAQEQIRQDQLRFKDEFLSHVSHELRSPLTAIKQFTSILLGGLAGELNPEQRAYQHIVLKNIGQLQSMIDDLLEVTRLETGKLTVESASVSVPNAVADSFNTLQGTADAKGVRLSCDLPAHLPRAHADQTRLRQVLIILLDNAIKFTPDGGSVTVRVGLLEQDPRFLLVEVSDTGCGISPEISERIFERLYQVSERIQASRKGLGLGLYICKELVTRQGGQIWVTRRPEKGTTLSFTLPVVSLNSSIAPLLRDDKWPAESVALVVVETSLQGAWPSKEAREEWSLEARNLLKRCFLPDLDVLLPTTGSDAEQDRFFVAAFADDASASVLASRIRGQFERLLQLKHEGLGLSVTYTRLPPHPRDAGASTDTIVASMATHLEAAIKSHSKTGDVHHE